MEAGDPRARAPDAKHERRSASGPVLFLASIALLGILTVGNAFVLNAAMGAFPPVWLGAMLFLEVAVIAGAFLLRPALRPVARWNGLEIVGMIVVGGAFLAHAVHLAPADLMPVSFSVDCSHQHLLVNYIYQNSRFPDGVDYLYIYDDYPVVPSALAAFSARALGVLPAQTMYPLAALLMATQVMLVYGVCVELLPRRPASHVLATLASLSVFLVYQYSVEVFTERFYSNMIMGNLIVLLALWVLTVRDRLHPLFVAGVGIGLVFGCLNSYPAWLPFVITPILASTMLDRRMSVRQRLAMAGAMGGVTAILTVTAIVDQWDFINWFAPVRDRRLVPGWESLGGAFLLLVGCGLWPLSRVWRERLGFALFGAIDFALVIALYGVALSDQLALYIPDKTFYFNVFLFAILAALSLDWLWERLTAARAGKVRISGGIMLATGLAAVALVNWQHPSPGTYPLTLGEYRVAYQVAQGMPDAELTYLVRTPTTFYWIYGSVLNHTHDLATQSERWQAQTPTYEDWIQDSTASELALVSSLAGLPQDRRWREILRAGNSGVIEKAR